MTYLQVARVRLMVGDAGVELRLVRSRQQRLAADAGGSSPGTLLNQGW